MAIREEMALSAEDVLRRRMPLSLLVRDTSAGITAQTLSEFFGRFSVAGEVTVGERLAVVPDDVLVAHAQIVPVRAAAR